MAKPSPSNTRELLNEAANHAANADWDLVQRACKQMGETDLSPADRAELTLLLAGLPDAQPNDFELAAAGRALLEANRLGAALAAFSCAARLSDAVAVARRDYILALGCAEAIGAELQIPRILMELARLDLRDESVETAEKLCQRALERLRPLHLLSARVEEARVTDLLGDILFASGRPAEASQFWTTAYEKLSGLGHAAAVRIGQKLQGLR